jgi:pyrimidine operon attenuation protein / uracil phosphoribosyltransferase
MSSHLVLDKAQTLQKIKRLAYQIYENNLNETEIIFIGIAPMGYKFAELLQKAFAEIAPIASKLVCLELDKQNPEQSEISLSCEISEIREKIVILADDVLNTGKTMIYALKPFFEIPIKKFQTALLINRNYKLFPISADYVGMALATTLQERITVILDNESEMGVYLS